MPGLESAKCPRFARKPGGRFQPSTNYFSYPGILFFLVKISLSNFQNSKFLPCDWPPKSNNKEKFVELMKKFSDNYFRMLIYVFKL